MSHSHLKYATVCSGIEAPSSAWHSLGWEPVWFSEIEPFPCKVLKHHYPQVPNLGDMTKLNEHEIYRESTIDLFCGGTPCQSFSIAGLRGGLDDERGNLALEFARILLRKQPRWFIWENVPGVFSSFTNETKEPVWVENGQGNGDNEVYETADFAAILNGFRECGYSCAYRVLDAQYFGVPQRRRRVFVVGYLGEDWRPPYAVLFERDSLRRHFEASAKERKGTTGKAKGDTANTGFFKMNGFGDYHQSHSASSLKKRDYKDATDLVTQTAYGLDEDKNGWVENSGTLQAHKSGGSEHVVAVDNQEIVFGVDFQQKGMVNENSEQLSTTICIQGSMLGREDKNGPQGSGLNDEVSFTLNKTDKHAVVYDALVFNWQNAAKRNMPVDGTVPTLDKSKTPAVVYDTTQITSPQNGSNPQPELCYSLAKGQHVPLVTLSESFQQNADGELRTADISFTLNKNSNASGRNCPLLIDTQRKEYQQDEIHSADGIMSTLVKGSNNNASGHTKTFTGSVARRLTPLECERLQGFPDNHTAIPGAKDGPRYAAIGNSMAVPVMKWIGERIAMMDKIMRELKAPTP